MALDIGHGRSIIVGNIVHYHIQEEFCDSAHGRSVRSGAPIMKKAEFCAIQNSAHVTRVQDPGRQKVGNKLA